MADKTTKQPEAVAAPQEPAPLRIGTFREDSITYYWRRSSLVGTFTGACIGAVVGVALGSVGGGLGALVGLVSGAVSGMGVGAAGDAVAQSFEMGSADRDEWV